mgnify:FL=1
MYDAVKSGRRESAGLAATLSLCSLCSSLRDQSTEEVEEPRRLDGSDLAEGVAPAAVPEQDAV